MSPPKNTPTNFSAPIHKKSQNVRHSQLRLSDFQKNRNTPKKNNQKNWNIMIKNT